MTAAGFPPVGSVSNCHKTSW